MTKHSGNYDLIVLYFSKNRPMQLALAMETFAKNCNPELVPDQKVLFKSNFDSFYNYERLIKNDFKETYWRSEQDFRLDLFLSINDYKYVLFVVDDTIFTRPFNLKTVIDTMEMWDKVLGFSLRLGFNTEECYSLSLKNQIPTLHSTFNNYYMFDWTQAGMGDFSYPLEVSSSLYRVQDIVPLLEGKYIPNPNALEWSLFLSLNKFKTEKPFMLCHDVSCAFSNPLNKVQTVNNNRASNNPKYSPEKLNQLFSEGYRIDSTPFNGFVSTGCHQEVDFKFIKKE